MLRDALCHGMREVSAEISREPARVWLQPRQGRLEGAGFAAAGWGVGVVFDQLPVAVGVEQPVEAAVQRAAAARVGWLLACQLEGGPWPGEGRPPVGVVEDAVDGLIEQTGEGFGEAAQGACFGVGEADAGEGEVAAAGGPGVEVEGAVSGACDALPLLVVCG